MVIFTSQIRKFKVGKNMSVSWFQRQPTVSADEKIAMTLPTWGRCCRHDAILCVVQLTKKSDGRTLEDFLHFGTPVADLRSNERKDNLPEIKPVKFFGDLTIFTDYNKLRVRRSRTFFFQWEYYTRVRIFAKQQLASKRPRIEELANNKEHDTATV